jgi:hypothetical protein
MRDLRLTLRRFRYLIYTVRWLNLERFGSGPGLMEILSRHGQYHGRDSNQAAPAHRYTALPLLQCGRCSLTVQQMSPVSYQPSCLWAEAITEYKPCEFDEAITQYMKREFNEAITEYKTREYDEAITEYETMEFYARISLRFRCLDTHNFWTKANCYRQEPLSPFPLRSPGITFLSYYSALCCPIYRERR